MDDGERCTTVWMDLVLWTAQLNMVKIVCFILCDFYHNLKKREGRNWVCELAGQPGDKSLWDRASVNEACVLGLVAQSWPTVCDPMDCSPPGSSVCGILQAEMLEWVAISFSRGSSRSRDQTWVSHIAGRFFTIWATREALMLIKWVTISPVTLVGSTMTSELKEWMVKFF